MKTLLYIILGAYLLYTSWYMIQVFRVSNNRRYLESHKALKPNIQAIAYWYRFLFFVVSCLLSAGSIRLLFGDHMIEGILILCVAMYMFLIRIYASRQIAKKIYKSIEKNEYKLTYLLFALYSGSLGIIILITTIKNI
jgi:uncharacterized membrane protein YjjP (DUF1212 family)